MHTTFVVRFRRVAIWAFIAVGLMPRLASSAAQDKPAPAAKPTSPPFEWKTGELKIDGKPIKLPCDVEAITAILGQPDRSPKGFAVFHIWDGRGIYASLNDAGKVQEVALKLAPSPHGPGGEFAAKETFSGELTVDGVKFDAGKTTFEDFWKARKGAGEKRRGGESIDYANKARLYVEAVNPGRGAIWKLAFSTTAK